jgi:oligopeptide/dipeptide ABC transporter ATP-binding protein
VEPRGCPFVPRCEYALDKCRVQNPPLTPVRTGHRIACWVDVNTGAPR